MNKKYKIIYIRSNSINDKTMTKEFETIDDCMALSIAGDFIEMLTAQKTVCRKVNGVEEFYTYKLVEVENEKGVAIND